MARESQRVPLIEDEHEAIKTMTVGHVLRP
jgi:hypothetical protein